MVQLEKAAVAKWGSMPEVEAERNAREQKRLKRALETAGKIYISSLRKFMHRHSYVVLTQAGSFSKKLRKIVQQVHIQCASIACTSPYSVPDPCLPGIEHATLHNIILSSKLHACGMSHEPKN